MRRQNEKPTAGRGGIMGNENKSDKSNSSPSAVPVQVVATVQVARLFLTKAQFDLGDDGFECLRLDDIVAHVSVLLSDWRGRQRPTSRRIEDTPQFIDAAVEWRRRRGQDDEQPTARQNRRRRSVGYRILVAIAATARPVP